MNRKKKLLNMFQPSMRLYFIILICFAAATFFFSPDNKWLVIGEVAVIIFIVIYTRLSARKRNNDLLKYIEDVTYNMDTASRNTLTYFPMPTVIFNPRNGLVMWSNDHFLNMTGEREHLFEMNINDVIPNFPMKWLTEGKNECPDLLEYNGKRYRLHGSIVSSESETGGHELLASVYFFDVTLFARLNDMYVQSRPVVGIIMVDNYDELLKNTTDRERSDLRSEIDERITEWVGDVGGLLCKYDRDRFIYIFEKQYLQKYRDDKFSVLENVRKIVSTNGVPASLSIGYGVDAESFEELFQFANLAIDMSLSRGGDQAVIKNKFNFEFYGGRTNESEKRSKVKVRVMANSFGELLGDASTVYITGHKMADMDVIGAAVGVCCMARLYGTPTKIIVDRENNAAKPLIDKLRANAEYKDVFISPQDAIISADSKSLLVVVDTGRIARVEAQEMLASCNRIAVIDHHRRSTDYIDNAVLNFNEPYASSACELVCEMLQYLVEQPKLQRVEAEAMLAGIVLDTKNFTLRTGSRTFDVASYLRKAGADPQEIKKMLQSNVEEAMKRYAIVSKAIVYRDGIAIAASDSKSDRITIAQAADELLNIAGIEASFVVCNCGEGIVISGRSMGDVNVQLILERLGGGGTPSTSGAQINDRSIEEVMLALKDAIDGFLDEAAKS